MDQAEVVIIGGGIAGVSVAYHLTRRGVTDVVVLERDRVTSGTTWHAAGLVGQLRPTVTTTEIAIYGARLYETLEAETGQATGFRRSGSISIARTPERLTELRRLADTGQSFGVEAHELSPREVAERHPLIDPARIVGGLWIPGDGQTDPVGTTEALAKGARAGGARIKEGVEVTGFRLERGTVSGVETTAGPLHCRVCVIAAGLWTRPLAALAGAVVPLYAAEHMYVTTTPLDGLPRNLPVVRDLDASAYVKEEAGKLVVGAFEPKGKPIAAEAVPAGGFAQLSEDWDQFAPVMQGAIELIPRLEHAPIRDFLNGPESFTPDNRFVMGETPEVRNLFVIGGFNSQGIMSGAGAGRAIADWIVEGRPTMDLAEVDVARFHRFQGNERYLGERIAESLGLLYAMHWPFRQMETARPVRRSPLHHQLERAGAVFGELAGWERANWYAPPDTPRRYVYSYGRQNWFPFAAAEHLAARDNIALFDLSSFAKYEVKGPDAEAELQRIMANDVGGPVGTVTYTQMLNHRGGIEGDVTVSRLGHDRFLVVAPAASQRRDFDWIERQLRQSAAAAVVDVTGAYAVLALMGPNAPAFLQRLVQDDLSDAAFPFRSGREIALGRGIAWAQRISYVGEPGFELYVPTEFAGPVFEELIGEGASAGLRLAGYHALDSLRLEKGFRHWGHDIGPTDTPLEAGLGFAIAWNKADFIGREALLRLRETPLERRLVQFRLADPEPLLFHDEPVFRDGRLVGRVTSGAYGHKLGAAVGMGYVSAEEGVNRHWLEAGSFEIAVAGERHGAAASLRAFL